MKKLLKDNDIVNALKCCQRNEVENTCAYCTGCPVSDCEYEGDLECTEYLAQEILDLIHRLQDEIKGYKGIEKRAGELLDENLKFKQVYAEQKTEIERLTEEKWKVQDDLDNYHAMLQESEKKNDGLQKQVKSLTEENEKLHNDNTTLIAGSILQKEQVEKDTSKEILQELSDFVNYETFRKGFELVKVKRKIKEIAKNKGVEVE